MEQTKRIRRIVGLDLAVRGSHRAIVLEGERVRGKAFSVAMTEDGLRALLRRATDGYDGRVSFAMEPSGPHWRLLSAFLRSNGHDVYHVKPQKVHDFRKFLHRHTKSDTTDAEAIARALLADPEGTSGGRVEASSHLSLRRLLQQREREVQDVAARKKRLKALLREIHPGYVELLGESWCTAASIAFLRTHVDPRTVEATGLDDVVALWTANGQGAHMAAQAEQVYGVSTRAATLLALAGDALPFDYVRLQEEITGEIDAMQQAQTRADSLEQHLTKLHRQLDANRTLEQLRGVGPIIAAIIDAYTGNVDRFPNASSFISYCGLCPRKNQTGMSNPNQPMTKAGPRLLKKGLYLAADTARQWDPDFAAYYARRYARGDHHNAVVIALARKMALRAFSLMRRRATEGQKPESQRQPVRYVLRNENAETVTKQQARELIATRYARSVIAPERAQSDRTRKHPEGKDKQTGAPAPQGDVAAQTSHVRGSDRPVLSDCSPAANDEQPATASDASVDVSSIVGALLKSWGLPVENSVGDPGRAHPKNAQPGFRRP